MGQSSYERENEPVGGVASPPDDGGHVGSYTVPRDTMDQSSESAPGGETAHDSTKKSAPGSGTPVLGLLFVVLFLFVVVAVTLSVGL